MLSEIEAYAHAIGKFADSAGARADTHFDGCLPPRRSGQISHALKRHILDFNFGHNRSSDAALRLSANGS